MNFWELR